MIGYCPLDEDPIERPQRQEVVVKPQAVKRKRRNILGDDDTDKGLTTKGDLNTATDQRLRGVTWYTVIKHAI